MFNLHDHDLIETGLTVGTGTYMFRWVVIDLLKAIADITSTACHHISPRFCKWTPTEQHSDDSNTPEE